MESFLLTEDSSRPECIQRAEGSLSVLVRWNGQGPTEPVDLRGAVACELNFQLSDDPGVAHRLQVIKEQGTLVNDKFVAAMCRIYGVRPTVDVFVIEKENLKPLGIVKVRG